MNVKNFVLSYYKNAAEGFHIHKLKKSTEAQKPHTHEYFQIYFVTKGSIRHFADGDMATLSKGDMFIIPPGIPHYIKESDGCEFYSFSFMADALGLNDSANALSKTFLKRLQNGENIKTKISIQADEILFAENLMEQIFKEFNSSKIGKGEMIRSCACAIVSLFARNYYNISPQELHVHSSKELMLHCIEYIKNNFSQDITLDNICRTCAMSKNSFCKMFFELTGTTFNKYLNSIRIRAAVKYINDGYKISGIYGLCGYNDFSTFYRNFKKIHGISPRQYKANIS